jgi:K+-transporting ATPase A subunit
MGGSPYLKPMEGNFYWWPVTIMNSLFLGKYIWPIGAILIILSVLVIKDKYQILTNPVSTFFGKG